MGRRIGDDERQEILRRWSQGDSVDRIAQHVGRSRWGIYMVLYRARQKGGLTERPILPRSKAVRAALASQLTADEAHRCPCPACGGPRRVSGILASCAMCGRTVPVVDGNVYEELRLLAPR